MRRSVLVYILALSAASGSLLIWSGNHVSRSDWPYLVLIAPVIVLSGLYYVTTQTRPTTTFSFESAMKVMALFVAGPPTALWAAAIGTLATGLIKGLAAYPILYNVGQSVLSLFVAGAAFTALGGRAGAGFDQPLAALVAGAVYLLCNTALLSQLFALLEGKSWLSSFRNVFSPQNIATFMVGQVAGIVGAFFVNHHSWPWLIMVVALLLLCLFSFRQYLSLLDNATLRGQELEAMLNATQSAILVTDQAERVRHVNPPFLALMGRPGAPGLQVGRHSAELAGDPLASRLLDQALAAAGPGETATAVLTATGPWYWIDYYRGPVKGLPGRADGVIHVFSDISAVKEAEERLRRLHESVLVAMASLIDARDPYTHGHSARVAEIARVLGRRLELNEEACQRLYYSGLLHDIGKIGVDDRILRKVGPLTAEERAKMMEHPEIGARLLEKAGVFMELLPGVRYHHEAYGGAGYPAGLCGDAIPGDARIIAVADAFDAMTSDRPYRRALAVAEAASRLKDGCGSHFDPAVVAAFLMALAAGEVAPSTPAVAADQAGAGEPAGMLRR